MPTGEQIPRRDAIATPASEHRDAPARPGVRRRRARGRSPTGALLGYGRSVKAASRTAVFCLNVLPMLPSRALNWVTPDTMVEKVSYPTHNGQAQGDLYRPATPGPHPGMVVCLGVVPFSVDHPQVPRLGEALARSGFAALLYWSPAMRDLRLDPEDAENIALAYDRLLQHPCVDAGRSGLLGTCVGGSFALMAAAHPLIRDCVSFVDAFAPYASMWTLAVAIASSTHSTTHGRAPWAVDSLTRAVYDRSCASCASSADSTPTSIQFTGRLRVCAEQERFQPARMLWMERC